MDGVHKLTPRGAIDQDLAMAWQDDNHYSTGCFRRPRNHRIHPLSCNNTSSDMVEIRHKRVLHVRHINSCPRDPHFEKEMQMQLLYKSKGLHAGVVCGGPLVMPPKKTAPNPPAQKAEMSLPNSVVNTAGGDTNSESTDRLSSATSKPVNLTSPSNVLVNVKDSTYTETGTHMPSLGQVQEGTTAQDPQSEMVETVSPPSNSAPLTPSVNKTAEGEPQNERQLVSQQASSSDFGNTVVSSLSFTSKTVESLPDNNSVSSGSNRPSILLFFIHGVGGSSDIWQNQIKCFAQKGYEVVAPDLIGHGLSSAPHQKKSYHFNEIAADMEELFDKYCKKKNIIIAHSYGCSFAVVLARRRSRRVHKLVLISGGSPTPLAPQPGIFKLPTCMLGCFRPCLNTGFKKSAFHKQSHPSADARETFSIPTYVLQHTMNGQDWPDGDEVYHQWLLCPTLLVHGEQDKLVSLKEEKHMAEVLFRAKLEIIPEAGHMVMIEASEEVNSLISTFIVEEGAGGENPPPPPPEERPMSRVSVKSAKSHKSLPNHLLHNSLL